MKFPDPTPEEMAALQNAAFFRLKLSLDDKVNELFKVLKFELEQSISQAKDSIPPELILTKGRTFRGENHQGFPWRALDCPRQMTKPDLFIFRTLLLWGHHFSCHVLLAGKWKAQLLQAMARNPDFLDKNWLIDLRKDAWQWQHPGEKSHGCSQMPSAETLRLISRLETVKISRFIPLEAFEQVPSIGLATWQAFQQSFFPFIQL